MLKTDPMAHATPESSGVVSLKNNAPRNVVVEALRLSSVNPGFLDAPVPLYFVHCSMCHPSRNMGQTFPTFPQHLGGEEFLMAHSTSTGRLLSATTLESLITAHILWRVREGDPFTCMLHDVMMSVVHLCIYTEFPNCNNISIMYRDQYL